VTNAPGVTRRGDAAVNADMEGPSDAELVLASRRGETEAFAQLVRRHRDRHARFVTRMLGDADDAEDVLQSVWVRAFKHLGRCEDPERFAAWVHRIVVNECRTYATRRGNRELKLVRDEIVLAGLQDEVVESDPALRGVIERALQTLPPDLREAFLLKHVEELEYEEMAEVTGAGVSALKMRVKRAIDKLREQLEGVADA
jgi:RNA polymerase sigma-70 factor, ECF subfamily